MKHNFDTIPAYVFDWMENLPFEKLGATQQREVMLYFSRDEYTEMHVAATGLKTVSGTNRWVGSATKQVLLNRFSNRHAGTISVLPTRSLVFWQAAAAILFLICGWMLLKLTGIKDHTRSGQMARIDTVYVDRELKSAPEIIHDTVFLYRYVKSAQPAINVVKPDMLPKQAMFVNDNELPGDLGTVSLDELESPANSIKGNSLKDDSLRRKYTLYSF